MHWRRPKGSIREDRHERAACEQWLRETLASGPALPTEIEQAGKAVGFSGYQLKRAKGRLRAVTNREGFGPGSKCYWSMGDRGSIGGAGAS
jgi:hypothetical protein